MLVRRAFDTVKRVAEHPHPGVLLAAPPRGLPQGLLGAGLPAGYLAQGAALGKGASVATRLARLTAWSPKRS